MTEKDPMQPSEGEPRGHQYTIVAAIDFSELADVALRYAFRMASLEDSVDFHVVAVGTPRGKVVHFELESSTKELGVQEAADLVRDHVKVRVDTYKTRHPELHLDRITTHLELGNPAEQITKLANDLDADVIVVGTHGRTGMKRLVLGSVAEQVLRQAECPVFVVHPKNFLEGQPVPSIAPPCPACLLVRKNSGGKELFCPQHKERHGRRHTYSVRPSGGTSRQIL